MFKIICQYYNKTTELINYAFSLEEAMFKVKEQLKLRKRDCHFIVYNDDEVIVYEAL